MAAINDVTGDALVSKASSEQYRNNWDAIFGREQRIREQKTIQLIDAIIDRYSDESDPQQVARDFVNNWLETPNGLFNGRKPIDHIETDMIAVTNAIKMTKR